MEGGRRTGMEEVGRTGGSREIQNPSEHKGKYVRKERGE